MTVMDVDAARAEKFGQRMLTTVNGAMLTLGISLGHRAGLYDAMAELGAVTSRQLADEAGLQERYVREWLAGQLAGGIATSPSWRPGSPGLPSSRTTCSPSSGTAAVFPGREWSGCRHGNPN